MLKLQVSLASCRLVCQAGSGLLFRAVGPLSLTDCLVNFAADASMKVLGACQRLHMPMEVLSDRLASSSFFFFLSGSIPELPLLTRGWRQILLSVCWVAWPL